MPHEILLIHQVAARLGVSVDSVRHYLAQRRKGQNSFPLPISPFKGKGRWLSSDVDHYIQSLSSVNDVAVPAKSKKRQERDYVERQQRAKATLERHGIKRTQKSQ